MEKAVNTEYTSNILLFVVIRGHSFHTTDILCGLMNNCYALNVVMKVYSREWLYETSYICFQNILDRPG
jgi:hypothetical protein